MRCRRLPSRSDVNMGTPSCHPYYFWIFPSKPFSYWGTPMTMETNGYGQTLHEAQFFCTQKDGKDTLYHLVAVRRFLCAFRWGWGNNLHVTLRTKWNSCYFSGFGIGMSVLNKVQTNVERFRLEYFTKDDDINIQQKESSCFLAFFVDFCSTKDDRSETNDKNHRFGQGTADDLWLWWVLYH